MSGYDTWKCSPPDSCEDVEESAVEPDAFFTADTLPPPPVWAPERTIITRFLTEEVAGT